MEIEGRIRELAAAAGIELASDDRCWIDGRVRCPYGTPEGQYILRPTIFCHAKIQQGDGCSHYHRLFDDPELTELQESEAINKHFESHSKDLTEEVRARAEELLEGSPERLTLELAADIIEEKELDVSILLEDTLPK